MLKVTVTFDAGANRSPSEVEIPNFARLTPKTAVVARNMAAGVGANAYVSDGSMTYRVTGNKARKVKARYD